MENLCHTHQTFWKELRFQTVVCIKIRQRFTQTIRYIYNTLHTLNITFKKMQIIWLTFIFQKQLHGNNYKNILDFIFPLQIQHCNLSQDIWNPQRIHLILRMHTASQQNLCGVSFISTCNCIGYQQSQITTEFLVSLVN